MKTIVLEYEIEQPGEFYNLKGTTGIKTTVKKKIRLNINTEKTIEEIILYLTADDFWKELEN